VDTDRSITAGAPPAPVLAWSGVPVLRFFFFSFLLGVLHTRNSHQSFSQDFSLCGFVSRESVTDCWVDPTSYRVITGNQSADAHTVLVATRVHQTERGGFTRRCFHSFEDFTEDFTVG
jgi:hypothetical protein